MMSVNPDVEKSPSTRRRSSKQTFNRRLYRVYVTDFDDILLYSYRGEGTEENPYIVEWLPGDPENPQTWNSSYKWLMTIFVAIATLAVTFCSSAYVGEIRGPLLWAPLSEVLGRRFLFILTYMFLTAFNAGAAASENIWTVIILRFFAGAFGSSPLTNAGGTIADMFSAKQRGLAMTMFASAPFLGPALGPIVGGFSGDAIGWRWVEGIMSIFTGVLCLIGSIFYAETYAPVLLRQRAEKLSKETGMIYRSKFEEKSRIHIPYLLKISLSRPWTFLFREPIVFLLSVYVAIIYGVLYMLFGAYPIVYEEEM